MDLKSLESRKVQKLLDKMTSLLSDAQSNQTSQMLEFANVVKSDTSNSGLNYKETLKKYAVISFWRFEND